MTYRHYIHKPFRNGGTLVFLDFDNTLLEYEKFKKEVWYKAFEDQGFKFEDVDETYKSARNSDGVYDYKIHLQNLSGESAVDEISRKFISRINNLSAYIYDEVHEFLNCNAATCNFVLLTYGEEDFQKHKFVNSGLSDFFHATIYTVKRKPEFFREVLNQTENEFSVSIFPGKKFRRIVFVDDHPEELTQDHTWTNFHQYRLKRKGGKYSDLESHESIPVVSSLNQIKINDPLL